MTPRHGPRRTEPREQITQNKTSEQVECASTLSRGHSLTAGPPGCLSRGRGWGWESRNCCSSASRADRGPGGLLGAQAAGRAVSNVYGNPQERGAHQKEPSDSLRHVAQQRRPPIGLAQRGRRDGPRLAALTHVVQEIPDIGLHVEPPTGGLGAREKRAWLPVGGARSPWFCTAAPPGTLWALRQNICVNLPGPVPRELSPSVKVCVLRRPKLQFHNACPSINCLRPKSVLA